MPFYKGHQRRLGVEAKGIVGKIDGVEVLQGQEGGEEGGEGGWNLREEAGGEDIGQYCGMEGGFFPQDRGKVRAGGNAKGVATKIDVSYRLGGEKRG